MSDEELLEMIRERHKMAEEKCVREVGHPSTNEISRNQWFREYLRDVRSLLHIIERRDARE